MKNKKINIGGILFSNVTMQETLELIEKKIIEYKNSNKNSNKNIKKSTNFLCVANQDIINQSKKIKELTYDNINKAFLIIPDGYSIIYASKFLCNPLKERIAGPDLMNEFILISNKKKYKNFFLGSTKEVLNKMIENFNKKYNQLKISGYYSPPFGEFSKKENNKIITMINNSKTDILWVSFGCPKQEKWILDNLNHLHVPVSIGIGAAFDFHSELKKRAPKFIRKLKLEWFYRLLQEPKRLWKRYLFGGFSFLKIILKQKIKSSVHRSGRKNV